MQARTDHTGMKATEDQTEKVRHDINDTPCLHSLPFPLLGLCIFAPGTPGLTSARLPAYPGAGGGWQLFFRRRSPLSRSLIYREHGSLMPCQPGFFDWGPGMLLRPGIKETHRTPSPLTGERRGRYGSGFSLR
jgi:hypothetical protein